VYVYVETEREREREKLGDTFLRPSQYLITKHQVPPGSAQMSSGRENEGADMLGLATSVFPNE
jgi:hypothetical protein